VIEHEYGRERLVVFDAGILEPHARVWARARPCGVCGIWLLSNDSVWVWPGVGTFIAVGCPGRMVPADPAVREAFRVLLADGVRLDRALDLAEVV